PQALCAVDRRELGAWLRFAGDGGAGDPLLVRRDRDRRLTRRPGPAARCRFVPSSGLPLPRSSSPGLSRGPRDSWLRYGWRAPGRAGLAPALGRLRIFRPGLDPAGLLPAQFLLPEGRARLQIVHE